MLNYSHLGTLRFTATHVDHFSKATACSYQHCLPCAVTILGHIFNGNNFHVCGVENWHVWHSGDNIYLPLRTTWSLPLLAKIFQFTTSNLIVVMDLIVFQYKPYNTTFCAHFSKLDECFNIANKRSQQFNISIYGSGLSGCGFNKRKYH